MAGKKGRSGRKKVASTIIKEAIDNDALNLPKYLEELSRKALAGNQEALQYLIDRHLGKPKQQTDLEVKGAVGLMTATEYRVLIEAVAREKIRLESGQRPLELEIGHKDSQQDA